MSKYKSESKTSSKPMSTSLLLLVLGAVILIITPFLITNSYVIKIISNVLLYSIIALSVNLIVGFSGQLDFGRSAFAGIGAYFSALTFTKLGFPFLVSLIGGGLFAALFGWLLGLLCRKTSFDYLTLITIGFSEITRLVINNWTSVTGGAYGFQTSRPTFFGHELNSPIEMYFFSLILLVISYICMYLIVHSKIGRAFQALRDDPIAASYSGINVKNYKVKAFAIASFFTGLGGAAMVHYTRFASATNYTIDESLIMLQMPILGGLGSLSGSIIGAAILVVIPELSRVVYQYRLFITGILMVLLMLFAPRGIMGRNGIKDKLVTFIKNKLSKPTDKVNE
jgi:branched-chain amino acid transport system permease protein